MTDSSIAPDIGTIAPAGDVHEGFTYGGIVPADQKPIWFLAAPALMNHFDAATWAAEHGGSLPTMREGNYLTSLKGKLNYIKGNGGALKEIFRRANDDSRDTIWLDDVYSGRSCLGGSQAWIHRLYDGDQGVTYQDDQLTTLCVRR